eukprot:3997690-Alexandrium_andersonii.AAC.1
MPSITSPSTPVTLAVPKRSSSEVPTVSWRRRRPVRTCRSTWLATAPRQEWSSTTRPAALAALRMAALARNRPTRVAVSYTHLTLPTICSV